MITIIDFGLGNIHAIASAYNFLNIPIKIASSATDLKDAEKLILPGVGAFDWAMTRLNDSGMCEVLDELVLDKHIPILGFCVGMQMMASRSEEGNMPGLGWLQAEIVRFQPDQISRLPLPHMGWNDVKFISNEPLFAGIVNPRFYFLHSYHYVTLQKSQILATTDYGGEFNSIVSNGHIFGVQFHPEKSHKWGVQLLKNFAEA